MANAWALTVDMTGVDYWEGYQLIPSGPYEVEMIGGEPAEAAAGSQPNSIVLSSKIVGGPHTPKYAGKEIAVYQGTDLAKEGVRRQWLSFGLSLGMDAEKIATKKVAFTEASLKDKEGRPRRAYIFVQNPPKNPDGTMVANRTDRRFVSKAHYEKLLTTKWPDDVDGVRIAPSNKQGNGATGGSAKPSGDFQVSGGAPAGGQAQAQPQQTPAPVAQQPAADDGF